MGKGIIKDTMSPRQNVLPNPPAPVNSSIQFKIFCHIDINHITLVVGMRFD